MQLSRWRTDRPALKELVLEASQALARLDSNRLEELALCCRDLNHDLSCDRSLAGAEERRSLAREAREASHPMDTLARILDATRANLQVMHRLRAVRRGELEYSPWEKTDGHD